MKFIQTLVQNLKSVYCSHEWLFRSLIIISFFSLKHGLLFELVNLGVYVDVCGGGCWTLQQTNNS